MYEKSRKDVIFMGIFSGLFKFRDKPQNSYDSLYSSDVNIKPDKEKSTEKIDGAVAMIMARDRAIRCGFFFVRFNVHV